MDLKWFSNGIHSLPRRSAASGSADIIYHVTHIAILRDRLCCWRHKVRHEQNKI